MAVAKLSGAFGLFFRRATFFLKKSNADPFSLPSSLATGKRREKLEAEREKVKLLFLLRVHACVQYTYVYVKEPFSPLLATDLWSRLAGHSKSMCWSTTPNPFTTAY